MAAAVATFTESTPGAIGMRTRRSTAARAAAVRPGPSAPSTSAMRSGASATSPPNGSASMAGVRATVVKPAARSSPRVSGQRSARANGTRSTCPRETRVERR